MNTAKRERQTAITSIWSHIEEQRKGTYLTQIAQAKLVLENRELNSRQIHSEIIEQFKYLDLSSCRRAITKLYQQDEIFVSKLDKCPITGKTVRFYKLSKKEKKEGQACRLEPSLFDKLNE